MGNNVSLFSNQQPGRDGQQQVQRDEHERKQRLLREQYGVLIPPTFIAVAGSKGYVDDGNDGGEGSSNNISISTQALLQRLDASSSPNMIDHLWNTNTGRTLLDEYMRPGFYLNAPINGLGRGGGGGQMLVAIDSDLPYWNNMETKDAQTVLYPPPSRVHPHVADDGAPKSSLSPPSSATTTPIESYSFIPTSSSSPFSSSFISLTTSFPPNLNVQLMAPMMMTTFSSSQQEYHHSCGVLPSVQVKSKALPYTTLSARFNHTNSPITTSASSSDGIIIVDEETGAKTVPSNNTGRVGSAGWINATINLPFIQTLTGIECVVGSWMTIESIRNLLVDKNDVGIIPSTTTSSPVSMSSTRRYAPTTIHVQGAAEYQESLLATHIEVPILTPNTGGLFVPEKTDTMLWLNLNGSGGADGNNTTTTTTITQDDTRSSSVVSPRTTVQYPPLWLTMKQSYIRGDPSSTWTLNLSQILTFDRKVQNILDDRAPMVRNHIGWVIQLDHNGNTNTSSWKGGASIQFNRNVAAKAVLDDNGRTLQYAIILKRWAQPRATLSILNSMDLTTNGGRGGKNIHSFVGFGLELETIPSTTTTTMVRKGQQQQQRRRSQQQAEYQETVNIEGTKVPPTKIQINHPK